MVAPVFVADEVVTATKMNLLPKGVLGSASVTANQTTITTEVDLTGLSIAVTVQASRRIKVTGAVRFQGATANDQIRLRIKEGATVLQQAENAAARAATPYAVNAVVVLTPTAGAHTYKLSLQRPTGTGDTTMVADATAPALILVEDIGGV